MTLFKNTISVLFSFFIFQSISFAQKGSLDLGVSFSLNIGTVEETFDYFDLTSISGFSTMVKFEYEPINRLRVSYGIGNLTKGYVMGRNQFVGDLTGQIYEGLKIENRLSYLSNQIMAGYRIGNKLSVTPEIGVSFDALLNQESIVSSDKSDGEHTRSDKDNYADWNTSLMFGLSVRYPITDKINLGVNFKMSNGQQSISSTESYFTEGEPNNYLIGAAFIWRLNSSKE